MEKYSWKYNGDMESFFRNVASAVVSQNHFNTDYYYTLTRKTNNRFIITRFLRSDDSSNQNNFYGKIEEWNHGLEISAVVRMSLLSYVMLTLLCIAFVFGFIYFLVNRSNREMILSLLLLILCLFQLIRPKKNMPIITLMDHICS